jgi:hypothetical protein
MNVWVPFLVAGVALMGTLYSVQASMRATRVTQEANQVKWVEDARKEAHAAKVEADEVHNDLIETRRELTQTKRELGEVRDLTEELTRWALRVVTWSHDDTMTLNDLRRLIDGGPPSLRSIERR